MTKVILITGASSGLGKATAAYLMQHKFHVLGTCREPKKYSSNNGVKLLPFDLNQPNTAALLVQKVLDKAGRIDVLINNAGILLPTAADPVKERANLEAMMDMHLHSPLRLIDALAPTLQVSNQPMIVNMISMAAFASVPGCEGYCTSKAALHAATQGLRLKHPNIHSGGVYPGPTATDMTAGSTAPLADAMESAAAILSGLCERKTAIFPDKAALAVESVVGAGVATLEQQFTTLLSD